jgi:LPS-assembly protein
VGHQHLQAQGVTTEEPPAAHAPIQDTTLPAEPTSQNAQTTSQQSTSQQSSSQESSSQQSSSQQSTSQQSSSQQSSSQQSPPDLSTIPHAFLLQTGPAPESAVLESDQPQSKHGDMYYASGNVVLTYGDHVLGADSLTYNDITGDVTAEGHVVLTGGDNDEHIEATHGTYNLHTQTGRFYDVHGSVEMNKSNSTSPFVAPTTPGVSGATSSRAPGYQNSNPFLFEGRIIVKTGPEDYTIYNGSVTTCLLPNPDWQLFARRITMDSGKAKAANSTFTLLGIPLLFFPYVTHPTDTEQRQAGLLTPVFGYSTASKDTGSKGLTIGQEVYLPLGRSADLTLGTIYYSLRGFSENGTFRYRGAGDDLFNAHFSALQDRGFNTPSVNSQGQPTTVYVNQGGEDITSSFRRQFTPHLRAVGDAEYLSSYIYREAFTKNFNQAVSTDITSILYLTGQKNGYSLDTRVDRYEGLKVVQTTSNPGEEVKIYHAPSIDFTGLDHPIPGTPLLWSVTASAAGLNRVQPNFSTGGITERLDLRPELSLPLHFAGWNTLSSLAVRETAYSRSRFAPYGNNAKPIELNTPLNRADVDLSIDIRPPAIERTFTVPERWRRLLGDQVRHTIEPDITYRNVHGIDNFLSVLRFDDIDLVSDTDELQYGVTQHLYFRPHPPKSPRPKPGCPAAAKPVISTGGAAAVERPAVALTTSTPSTTASEDASTASTPDTLNPDEQTTTDANGIPSSNAPDQPLRTHARKPDPCAPSTANPPQQEWFSWLLTQKHFFEPTFGGAVIDERRNIFDTTLDFSGIAFLTQPRSISPLKSRMRFRTSSHADIEWDFDYDTGAKKFTSSNTFLNLHEGRIFGGVSYARLNAPGKTYTEVINTVTNTVTGLTSSAISNFSQMRFLFGYGKPSEPGLSAAVSSGIDLNLGSAQYITIQTTYNWNCCGLSVEYRKYNLGTIRDEGAYSFNFTLANIGTAGNLRRAESLF